MRTTPSWRCGRCIHYMIWTTSLSSERLTISYAQRFEDIILSRCFTGRPDGFYIDIGSGHPVYDNTSFAFYLAGWRGVTVEPNPWLARLSRAVRPRDHHIEAVVGMSVGEATFFLVEDFHGLSTVVESHARSAQTQFGKSSQSLHVPMTTLEELCESHASQSIDFLKVDVEGAERDVLLSGDWRRYRPVAEALAPYSLAPAWQGWESFLEQQGYRYAWFDSLNRYYLAEEARELADAFERPLPLESVFQYRNTNPALADEQHPDHHLARLFAAADMTRLPLLGRDLLCEMLTADVSANVLQGPAGPPEIVQAIERLFGSDATLAPTDLELPACPSLRDVYAAIIQTDQFCAACGRISASYAW
ncbi:MAG: FkbM family methyltransferase [Alphaproteobacteria bacterium]|nr:MAG: FkbM family methyltransferase [Alphaproteobacteria bacterium]